MDIDEFLDRELADLGLETGRTEKPATFELPQFKEDFEPSSLFDNIKANLGKGNFELAEQSYTQLWHILMQQKLKWNKDLYEQLAILSRQFSSILIYASNEVKKKANQIYDLINRARASLKEGKKELSFKLYAEIETINNSIPNIFFEEKKLIQEQITNFYKELKYTTDNELLKRVSALLQDINQLIDNMNASISRHDMTNAVVNYNKCLELYNQIPEGFLRHKNSAGVRLLDIYKVLSINTEISNLQKQLSSSKMGFSITPVMPDANLRYGAQLTKKITREPSRALNLRAAKQQLQFQQPQVASPKPAKAVQLNASDLDTSTKSKLLKTKKERAKKSIEKGFYNEASKSIEEALQIEPKDAEALAIRAKITTLS